MNHLASRSSHVLRPAVQGLAVLFIGVVVASAGGRVEGAAFAHDSVDDATPMQAQARPWLRGGVGFPGGTWATQHGQATGTPAEVCSHFVVRAVRLDHPGTAGQPLPADAKVLETYDRTTAHPWDGKSWLGGGADSGNPMCEYKLDRVPAGKEVVILIDYAGEWGKACHAPERRYYEPQLDIGLRVKVPNEAKEQVVVTQWWNTGCRLPSPTKAIQ